MLTVSPNISILLGGSLKPAYLMNITALASSIEPTKNQRSTAMMRKFMLESLAISPERGVIRFQPIAEADLGIDGKTVLQGVEGKDRHFSQDTAILGVNSMSRGRKGKSALEPIAMEQGNTPTSPSRSMTAIHAKPNSGETGDSNSLNLNRPEKKRLTRRHTILSFLGN